MNITPNHSTASIAGAPHASANSDAGGSSIDNHRQARQATDATEASEAASINEGEHADDRNGDGRQLAKQPARDDDSNADTYNESMPAAESPKSKANHPHSASDHLDYQA